MKNIRNQLRWAVSWGKMQKVKGHVLEYDLMSGFFIDKEWNNCQINSLRFGKMKVKEAWGKKGRPTVDKMKFASR